MMNFQGLSPILSHDPGRDCAKAGIGLATLRNFENGKAYNVTMTNFLALLRTVGQLEQMEEVLPEIPISPYDLELIESKKPKRIRHAK